MVEKNRIVDIKYAKNIARRLCDEGDSMKYVLTALANAIQEQLGEDILLCPRHRIKTGIKKNTKKATPNANVVSVVFEYKSKKILRHYVFYGIPEDVALSSSELLKVTLDVAHELGHLLLDRGLGRIPLRVGAVGSDLERIREIEADWFALCILQMYGFLSPKFVNKR